MSIARYLTEKINGGTVHITLIDPMKQTPEVAGRLALTAQEVGSDLILVLGVSGLAQRNLLDTAISIREKTCIPLVYSPAGAEALCFSFDAFLFSCLLNSRNAGYTCGGQSQAAVLLKRMEVETIPVGLVMIEPGLKTGDNNIDLVPRDNHWQAVGYAAAAELFGMSYVYLEAGPNSAQPISGAMIRAVTCS